MHASERLLLERTRRHFFGQCGLGIGGMASVFLGRNPEGYVVAIKVLPDTASGDRLARLEREARIAGALNHPHVVTLFDVGSYEGRPYVVMERLEGETVRASVGSATVKQAVQIGAQAARGLAAAHDKGIKVIIDEAWYGFARFHPEFRPTALEPGAEMRRRAAAEQRPQRRGDRGRDAGHEVLVVTSDNFYPRPEDYAPFMAIGGREAITAQHILTEQELRQRIRVLEEKLKELNDA